MQAPARVANTIKLGILPWLDVDNECVSECDKFCFTQLSKIFSSTNTAV